LTCFLDKVKAVHWKALLAPLFNKYHLVLCDIIKEGAGTLVNAELLQTPWILKVIFKLGPSGNQIVINLEHCKHLSLSKALFFHDVLHSSQNLDLFSARVSYACECVLKALIVAFMAQATLIVNELHFLVKAKI
jgi:hypothetical protein